MAKEASRDLSQRARRSSGAGAPSELPQALASGAKRQPPLQGTAPSLRPVTHPRKIPDSTALGPASAVTVIETVPPAATLIGKDTHAPWLKSLESTALWPLTVMTSRRPAESQSSGVQAQVCRCRLR